jgi:hypothetical protein
MLERYVDLPKIDQAELLQSLAPVIGRRAEILEKDIWLCLVLDILFKLPCRKHMAFKGGTSLSKVYKVISRFSEDIDVTVDYSSLVEGASTLISTMNNTQRKKLSELLKERLVEHIHQELVPELKSALAEMLPNKEITLEVSEDAEKLWIFYPSAVENIDTYLRPSILIEFGGRNSTLPQKLIEITPDVAGYVAEIEWPKAQVSVLSPMRTFWEKVTLIHVECHRSKIRIGADRLSRHWYDLACLADDDIGRQAVKDIALLKDVIHIKETFFRSGNSNYDRCLMGEIRLIPDSDLLEALNQDYQAMRDAQMFYDVPMLFENIIERLRLLEKEINQLVVDVCGKGIKNNEFKA